MRLNRRGDVYFFGTIWSPHPPPPALYFGTPFIFYKIKILGPEKYVICVVHCRHDQHGLRRFREIFAETSQDTRRFTNFWRIFHVFFAKFRQNYADISWVFRENFASLAKFSRNVLQMFVSVSWKFHEIFAKCSSNVRECFVSVSWDLRKLFYKCTLQMYPRAEVA